MPYVNQERLVLKFPTVWFHAHSWPGPDFQRPQRSGQCYTSGVSSWKPCAPRGSTIRDRTSFALHWILFCSGLLRLKRATLRCTFSRVATSPPNQQVAKKCLVTSSFHEIKSKRCYILIILSFFFQTSIYQDIPGGREVRGVHMGISTVERLRFKRRTFHGPSLMHKLL